MPRVCFDSQMFSFFAQSGVAKYFAQLSLLLPSHDWMSYFPFHYTINKHYFELGGTQLRRVPQFRGAKRLCRWLNHLDKIDHTKFDVWHSTFYDTYFIDTYGSENMVTTVHDMIPEIFPNYFPSNPHNGKLQYVNASQRIIAVSNNTRNDICRLYGTSRDKIDVIHHGIDPNYHITSPLNLPEDFIMFVGAREGYKNFDKLLEAYAALARKRPDIKLVCIGVRNFSPAESARIRDLGLKGVIHTNATDGQLRYALRRARLFVYPSLYEGFGMPLIEAMAQHCPMAIADASCFPEIAQDSAAYFDPTNVESIRDVLERLLSDVDLRQKLVAQGEQLVSEYSIEKMLRQTANTYRKTL